MRPFVGVKMLNSEDYKQLRELAKGRKLPAMFAKSLTWDQDSELAR